jgi:hypothetical protein
VTSKQTRPARLPAQRRLSLTFPRDLAGRTGLPASWMLVSRTVIFMAARTCLLVAGTIWAAVACASAQPPHPVVSPPASSSRPAPCRQQYAAWRDGPVRAANRRLTLELRAVRTAARLKDMTALRSSMPPLMRTAILLAGQPIPRCADVRGIFADYLVDGIYRAGHDARSATELSGLLRAAAVLAKAATLQRQLTAEIRGALGSRQCPPARQGSPPHEQWPPC